MFITIIEARQCSFSLITWPWLKKLLAFYLIFFQPAIIITVCLKSILKQGYYENLIKQKLVYNAKLFYSGLIIIISSSGYKRKISNQSKKDAISNIPQRKKKVSNLLQNNEMFWLME